MVTSLTGSPDCGHGEGEHPAQDGGADDGAEQVNESYEDHEYKPTYKQLR